jgi:hypothetical protein
MQVLYCYYIDSLNNFMFHRMHTHNIMALVHRCFSPNLSLLNVCEHETEDLHILNGLNGEECQLKLM